MYSNYSASKYTKERDKFIYNEMKKNSSVCIWNNNGKKYTVNKGLLKGRLNYKFNQSTSMMGISCYVNEYFNNNPPRPSDFGKKLSEGAEGKVFNITLKSGVEFVVKRPNQGYNNDSIIEYFKGWKAINKLRNIIPNFAYTIATFNYDNVNHIVYENIKGKTLYDYIKNGTLKKIDDIISVFLQILLALHVAQREIRFTHYDLHTSNIILRDPPIGKKHHESYSVNIGNQTYTIRNPKKLVTIIDFGFASVNVEPFGIIGTTEYEHLNIHPRFSAGSDMYRILISLLVDTREFKHDETVRDKIYYLFKFFKDRDPYVVYDHFVKYKGHLGRNRQINLAATEYCSSAYTGSIGNYTPAEFILWIMEKPDLRPSGKVLFSVRNNWTPYSLCDKLTPNVYYDIINEKRIAEIISKKEISLCSTKKNKGSGYISSVYYIHVLKDIKFSTDVIEKLAKRISENKKVLQSNDDIMLKRFFEPPIIKIDVVNKILNNILNYMNNDFYKTNVINAKKIYYSFRDTNWQFISIDKGVKQDLQTLILFYNNINQYFILYYTILELQLTKYKIYKEWVEKVNKSKIFRFYCDTFLHYDKIRKWMDNGIPEYFNTKQK